MGFGVFIMIPMLVLGGGFNSPWPTLCILFILDCQKNLILKIKLPDPIMKILTILTKTAEC